MIKKERFKKLKETVENFDYAIRVAKLTTRLMKAFIRQVELDEERRGKEGGEKR